MWRSKILTKMEYIKNKQLIFKRKDKVVEHKTILITKQKSNSKPAIQIATETRISKYIGSKYENAPSREINKWFESRRF